MQKLKLKTDQNVPIEVELASIGQRLLAVFLDIAILIAYLLVMSLVIMMIFSSQFNLLEYQFFDFWSILFMLVVYIPFALYTPLMEYFTKGQTIGKMAIGIRVSKINGENATFRDCFTRWLFRPYELYILLLFNGGFFVFIASFFFDTLIGAISNKNQRIGDFMANTVVIRQKPKQVYTIKQILAIQNKKEYIPKYLGITQYTDEDMMLVKHVLTRMKKHDNKATREVAIQLADKIAEDLKLEEIPTKKLQFLKTVLKDYIVLTR
ncbi:hypothetical protein CW751_01720 [Brumimicrobium salinarum]|uniref:RDD domain-containing protein n=1 Tax=Brumimicrobium salinarum TaxID=2058658 RepID=A0A2I0R673_9FLAO|nr:RDD family protein [Brumimicrobium salinarum]PKR82081.1 hypothetical protein CW751_01720 [Brumimicrobium salinarum]